MRGFRAGGYEPLQGNPCLFIAITERSVTVITTLAPNVYIAEKVSRIIIRVAMTSKTIGVNTQPKNRHVGTSGQAKATVLFTS
jgi:hypothetical protein